MVADVCKAVVLLSGGMDSATTLAIARQGGFETYALTFQYGQRHKVEIEAARRVARHLGVARQIVFDLDLAKFGGSALTDEIPVPKSRSQDQIGRNIPATYVPARNTIFLSVALGWAEVLGAHDIFIGVSALDFSGYPDCRREYIQAFGRMAQLATRAGVEGQRLTIHTPLIEMTKKAIVQRGMQLGVDFSITSTCYDPPREGEGCGECDACRLRLKGFAEAGLEDPLLYRSRGEVEL